MRVYEALDERPGIAVQCSIRCYGARHCAVGVATSVARRHAALPGRSTAFESLAALDHDARSPAMFLGTLPRDMVAMVEEHARGWDGATDLYVGCSGSFTFERLFAGKLTLHGNDVLLYSAAVARWLLDEDMRIEVAPDYTEDLGWLSEFLTTPIDRAATMLLGSRALQGIVGTDNPFLARQRAEFARRWRDLHARTVTRIGKARIPLASFYCGDVMHHVREADRDQPFVVFPPWHSGTYERQFRHLSTVFSWDAPAYDLIDRDKVTELFDLTADRRHWLFASNLRLEAWDRHLRGRVQTTNRQQPVFIYGSRERTRVVAPRQHLEPCTIPRPGPDEDLGDTITLARLAVPEFNSLRSLYLNPTFVVGQVKAAVGVIVGGKLVGCIAFADPIDHGNARLPSPIIPLRTDFPVAGTKYPRLSRLIVAAALSTEFQGFVSRVQNRKFRALTTTAYSQNPTSMKYRGLLRLLSRENADEGEPYAYILKYGAELGQWPLADAFADWRAKHAEVRT